MWCGTCQSDVVTEVASDHRRVSCSICGATLGETAASQGPSEDASPRSARTSQAKDLLDRWAKSPLFDPYGPARTGQENPASPAAETPGSHEETPRPPDSPEIARSAPEQATPATASPPAELPANEPAGGNADELDRLTDEILSRVAKITDSIRQPGTAMSEAATSESPATLSAERLEAGSAGTPPARSPEEAAWRVDPGHTARPHDTSPAGKSFDAAGNPVSPGRSRESLEEQRFDPSVSQASPLTPHAESVQSAPASLSTPPQKSGFVGGIGQVLAYLGILGLTAGTSLVIVGYFGGPAHYAPTGWLITTIGQMMLFLGVVTLVSTGMEQTQAEVRESLDETLREVSSKIGQLGQSLSRVDMSADETTPSPHSLSRSSVETEAPRSTQQ